MKRLLIASFGQIARRAAVALEKARIVYGGSGLRRAGKD
jgi:hypothetical protein